MAARLIDLWERSQCYILFYFAYSWLVARYGVFIRLFFFLSLIAGCIMLCICGVRGACGDPQRCVSNVSIRRLSFFFLPHLRFKYHLYYYQ